MQYSIKAAAMATGVTEGRLRTWERRYGIPQPNRSASGHRKFNDEDLYVIRRMAALIDSGMGAAEAADAASNESGEERPEPVTPQRANPLVDLFVQKALSPARAGNESPTAPRCGGFPTPRTQSER